MVTQTIILVVLALMVVGYALFLTLCVLGRFLWAIIVVVFLYAAIRHLWSVLAMANL